MDEQLEKLIGRLRPHQPAIRALVERLHAREDDDGGARLQVVRYLDVDEYGQDGD